MAKEGSVITNVVCNPMRNVMSIEFAIRRSRLSVECTHMSVSCCVGSVRQRNWSNNEQTLLGTLETLAEAFLLTVVISYHVSHSIINVRAKAVPKVEHGATGAYARHDDHIDGALVNG